MGDESSWRCGDGSFSTDRDALERACEIRVARAPQSNKWIRFSECVCRFDRHRLRPLLRGRRKTPCVDELDSSGHRHRFANFVANPYPFRKEDTPYGSILNEIALCVWRRRGSTSKVPLLRVPTHPLMRAVVEVNFKLRTHAAYSIFTPRSESSRHREFLLWQKQQN